MVRPESCSRTNRPLQRTFPNRLRPLFGGLSLLATLQVLLIVSFAVQTDVTIYPTLPAAQIVSVLAQRLAAYSLALLPLLPLAVIALNLAPAAKWLRIAWLLAVALAYGIAAAAIGPRTSEELTFILFALFITGVFEFQYRAAAGEGALARAQLEAVALDAEMTRARLQLLRAQIEPHFLFNTLANVRQLARSNSRAAAEMLDNLMHYFSAALPSMRNEETTLAEEAELIDAYLSIHRIRMGERLTYQITIPAELADARMPSMMLLTLVENSIKHGLTPLTAGGAINVTATRGQAALQLTVTDSGQGMTATAGSGTGLANIRSRLTLLYGSSAALSLAPQQPHGVAATITIPASVNP